MALDAKTARRALAALALAGCLAALPLAGCAGDARESAPQEGAQETAEVSDAAAPASPGAADVTVSAKGALAYAVLDAQGNSVDLSECSEPADAHEFASVDGAHASAEDLAADLAEVSADGRQALEALRQETDRASESGQDGGPSVWWWDAERGGDLRLPGLAPGKYRLVVLAAESDGGVRAVDFAVDEGSAGHRVDVSIAPDGEATVQDLGDVAGADSGEDGADEGDGSSDAPRATAPDGHEHTEGYGGMTWD